MEKGVLNERERIWLQEKYPFLRYCKEKKTIVGTLEFRAQVDAQHPTIKDSYKIRMHLQGSAVPIVKEYGSPKIDIIWRRFPSDQFRHINNDGSFCIERPRVLCEFLEKDGTLQGFFEKLLIPFLYYHSYLDRYGKEPWRGASHGDIGILEDYFLESGECKFFAKQIYKSLSQEFQDVIDQKKALFSCSISPFSEHYSEVAFKGLYALKKDLKSQPLLLS